MDLTAPPRVHTDPRLARLLHNARRDVAELPETHRRAVQRLAEGLDVPQELLGLPGPNHWADLLPKPDRPHCPTCRMPHPLLEPDERCHDHFHQTWGDRAWRT